MAASPIAASYRSVTLFPITTLWDSVLPQGLGSFCSLPRPLIMGQLAVRIMWDHEIRRSEVGAEQHKVDATGKPIGWEQQPLPAVADPRRSASSVGPSFRLERDISSRSLLRPIPPARRRRRILGRNPRPRRHRFDRRPAWPAARCWRLDGTRRELSPGHPKDKAPQCRAD
jgi:hypothetical protein